MRPNVTLTSGIRVDVPMFPDKPTANPVALTHVRLRHRRDAGRRAVLAARRFQLGPARRRRREQMRGGMGMFSGRTPYVWLSNQYGNTGIEFQRIGASNNAGQPHSVRPDPGEQPHDGDGRVGRRRSRTRSTSSIPTTSTRRCCAATSPTTGSCRGAWWRTAEFVYTKNMQDVKYQNLNRVTCTLVTAAWPGSGARRPSDSTRVNDRARRRDLPDQLRRGRRMERTRRIAPAVPRRLVLQRVLPLRQVDRRSWKARRARRRRTGATCSSRTIRTIRRWHVRCTTRATASTSPASYEIPFFGGITGTASALLLRPVRSSVHADVLRRRQRRRPHGRHQRPAVHSGVGDGSHVHRRHVSAAGELPPGGWLPGRLHRQDHSAQRLPRAVVRTSWTSASTSGCRSSASRRKSRWTSSTC